MQSSNTSTPATPAKPRVRRAGQWLARTWSHETRRWGRWTLTDYAEAICIDQDWHRWLHGAGDWPGRVAVLIARDLIGPEPWTLEAIDRAGRIHARNASPDAGHMIGSYEACAGAILEVDDYAPPEAK